MDATDIEKDYIAYRWLHGNCCRMAFPRAGWVDFHQPPFELVMAYDGDIQYHGNLGKHGITRFTIAHFDTWAEVIRHDPTSPEIRERIQECRAAVARGYTMVRV